MKHQSQPVTVTLTVDTAKAIRVMSRVFGQSHDQFVEMILQKFFLEQAEDRVLRVEMIAELLSEMRFTSWSEAEEAATRLEVFASVYGPKHPKEIVIRTDVIRYRKGDWGAICDWRHERANGSWHPADHSHRPLIVEKVAASNSAATEHIIPPDNENYEHQ